MVGLAGAAVDAGAVVVVADAGAAFAAVVSVALIVESVIDRWSFDLDYEATADGDGSAGPGSNAQVGVFVRSQVIPVDIPDSDALLSE